MDPPSVCEITNTEIDRISQLPNEILHYILSFVDIVDVVRVSVLSRRWKLFWTTLPYLNFDCDDFSRQHLHQNLRLIRFEDTVNENFQELINWVLLCQGSTNITRFRLSCKRMFYNDKIARWIQVAMRRNVQELELYFTPRREGEAFEFPNCESLRVLKLSLSGSILELPNYLKFNQLTSLYLEDVELTDEDLTRRLFSECSFLEELVLINCVMTDMVVIDISSSSLKCLTFMDEICAFGSSRIRISCPNLISFTYMAAATRNFYLNNLPSLDNLCIEIFPKNETWPSEESGHLACNILEQVENIRVLKLHSRAIWFLSDGIKELQCFSKTFCRLKSLNLSIEIAEDHIQVMFVLLKYCPNIESLHLYCESNFLGDIFTQCHQSYDQNCQLRFVKFMLKNGLVLENFTITLSEDAEDVQKLLRLLQ